MRAVVTRVKNASVVINEQVNGQIGTGFLVLLGVGPNDTEVTADKLADKICNLRVFEDENEKMNLNLEQVGGSLLVVSQFTLYADTSSRRPGFSVRPSPIWPSPSMSGSWPTAGSGASMCSTANSAPICRSIPRTTVRSPSCSTRKSKLISTRCVL